MAGPRRRKAVIGQRRRVEDEAEDEGGPDALDLEDDSLTEGSVTDEGEQADDSDTSNIDEASPTSARGGVDVRKPENGAAKGGRKGSGGADAKHAAAAKAMSETDIVLNGMGASDEVAMQPVREMSFDDVAVESSSPSASRNGSGPIVVSSGSASRAPETASGSETAQERRRREHEEYRRRRDEDPSFVPNRGAFFMHDHRHSGPAANGFRPFNALRGGRGQLNGGGRGGFGHFASTHHLYAPADSVTSGRWKHDMHEAIEANPTPPPPAPHHRSVRRPANDEGPPNGDGFIPTCPTNPTPINRTLSTERYLGNVQVRVNFPPFDQPVVFTGIPIKQYTKLPDHRPPLRRDKPVRISLPGHPPRYIFPASDRSFIFIPRALRPNQQKARGGRARSGLGSVGGYSRRTSIFGGSFYGGSTYSPSIALSRRSSIAPDMMGGRDFIISPTGSAFSRPPLPVDAVRPVVRLPPQTRQPEPYYGDSTPVEGTFAPATQPGTPHESTLSDVPPPQVHPLPQKPVFPQEQRSVPAPLTVHQPRPQKAVSVENIESPTMAMHQQPSAVAQPFHQQMPVNMGAGYPAEAHHRQNSFVSQQSAGTPLSQIPERAIHAAPFQPTAVPYAQATHFYAPQFPVMQPQPGFYYPPQFQGAMGPSAAAPAFVPAAQQAQAAGYVQQGTPADQAAAQTTTTTAASNLVAQEVNGMVYYYDASQLAPSVSAFPPPAGPMPYGTAAQVSAVPSQTAYGHAPVGVPVGMPGGMVTPGQPDATGAATAGPTYYYPQAAPGFVYYSQ